MDVDNLSHIEQRIANLEKSVNDTLDTVHPDTALSVLWQDFEINLGRFLLSLWRNFRNGFRLVEPDVSATLSLQDVFDREIERRRQLTQPEAHVQRVHYGYSTQEVTDALCIMVGTSPSMRDCQPEECSFTPINDDGFAFVLPVEQK